MKQVDKWLKKYKIRLISLIPTDYNSLISNNNNFNHYKVLVEYNNKVKSLLYSTHENKLPQLNQIMLHLIEEVHMMQLHSTDYRRSIDKPDLSNKEKYKAIWNALYELEKRLNDLLGKDLIDEFIKQFL